MTSIVDAFLKKEPRFPSEFEYLFYKFCRKGGGSEDERLDKAKVFRNNYELYMYAFFVGLKKNLSIKFVNRSKQVSKENVWNIGNWKPRELRDHLVACVLAEANTPLREYDLMSEAEINTKSVELRLTLEEYVYGGLSIIDRQYKEDKSYFIETFAFTEFVFE